MARFVNAFPLWVTLCGVLAVVHPASFTWFKGPMIRIGLGVIMLGMGLTLRWPDFARVLQRPRPILVGVALQFLLMPTLGYAFAELFELPRELAIGLILVSCCPGGTASNVIAFIARCDVALSVSMTSISTMLAVLMTPLLTSVLASSRVDVDALGLVWSTASVVLLPVTVGVLIRKFAPNVTERYLGLAPALAVIMIILIVGSILGSQRDQIFGHGLAMFAAIVATHSSGFLLGRFLPPLVGARAIEARTIAIEVGMQNSGLGVVLARSNFANPLVALPCAISSVIHCILGSLSAAIFAARPPQSSAGGTEQG